MKQKVFEEQSTTCALETSQVTAHDNYSYEFVACTVVMKPYFTKRTKWQIFAVLGV